MMTGNGVMHNGTTVIDEYGLNLDRLKVSFWLQTILFFYNFRWILILKFFRANILMTNIFFTVIKIFAPKNFKINILHQNVSRAFNILHYNFRAPHVSVVLH